MANNLRLEDDHYCFGCGSLNVSGLKLIFKVNKENKTLSSEFTPQKIYQGYKDMVHGGIIGLILDECMVNLVLKLGVPAVSAEYTVRLKRPAIVGKKLIFSAKIAEETKSRLVIVESECRDEDGIVIASASSKCVKIS
ncbi:MAG: PaaI family thioesterase [Candidatus Omnitrophota bacterium]